MIDVSICILVYKLEVSFDTKTGEIFKLTSIYFYIILGGRDKGREDLL